MYNIDLANVKSIVADIVAKHNVENVAFVAAALPRQSCTPQSTSWQTAARSFVWHTTPPTSSTTIPPIGWRHHRGHHRFSGRQHP